MPRILARVVAALLVAVFGSIVGITAILVHPRWYGLLIAAVALLAPVLALAPRWWLRPPYALGVAVALWFGATTRPSGSFLIAADPAGFTMLGLGAVLLAVGIATMRPRPREDAPDSERISKLPR